jgi:hypothetical protein
MNNSVTTWKRNCRENLVKFRGDEAELGPRTLKKQSEYSLKRKKPTDCFIKFAVCLIDSKQTVPTSGAPLSKVARCKYPAQETRWKCLRRHVSRYPGVKRNGRRA